MIAELKNRLERRRKAAGGFTLLELVITLTVLAILVMGTIPLTQNAVKRQREMRLREQLRLIRNAIDEFKRDSIGACPQGAVTTGDPTRGGGRGPQPGASAPPDPRSRVVIDDCTIFDSDNLDRYPPTLEALVDGVKVKARGVNMTGGAGLGDDTRQATEINSSATEELTKVYLRAMPIDPMTGESDWRLRSSYQDPDDSSWDSINVFDVSSASDAEAMNGEKYSDW